MGTPSQVSPGASSNVGVALNLELEQSAGAQQTMHVLDVACDDLQARDVLEHDAREREVELNFRQHGQVHAVVLIQVDVGPAGQRAAGTVDHLAADVHGVDFAEHLGERPCDAARAAANLDHLHPPGVSTLADVVHVREDFFLHGLPAGEEELRVRPVLLAGSDIEAGILAGALVPIRLHLLELLVAADRLHQGLL